MSARELPSAEVLKELFRYDPATGHLYRRKCYSSFCRPLDEPTGTKTHEGYLVANVRGFKGHYLVHRIIWKMVHGHLDPALVIDHINHNEGDNRLANLRAVTPRANLSNMRKSITNTTGTTGVYPNAKRDRWTASIYTSNRKVFLGTYLTEAEAIAARRAAEFVLGFHPNHGRMVQLEAA